MNAVEDRLRDALRERAKQPPIDPEAWERTVARTRRQNRIRATAWPRFMIPAAAAAAVVVIVVGVAALTGRGGSPGPRGGSGVTTTPQLALPSATPSPPGPTDPAIRQVPPVSAIVPVKLPAGGQTAWTFVWFGYNKSLGGLQLASVLDAGQYGGAGSGVARLSAHQVARWCGEAGTVGTDTIRLGVSQRQVSSVIAQLPGGRTIAGKLVSGRGFPYKVWVVVYPTTDSAQVIFRNARGHELGQLLIVATSGVGATQPPPYATAPALDRGNRPGQDSATTGPGR